MPRLITNLKSQARQQIKVQIENADMATFTFYYLPSQQGWFFDVEYGDFVSKGLRLVNSYNVLTAYFNILRFGLSCQVSDGSEPFFVDDFATERVKLFLLTEEEVLFLESVF
jgi:hypothetical protein